MSHWPPPERTDSGELQELSRVDRGAASAGGTAAGVSRRTWLIAAFIAGVLLGAALGLFTDIFDSGPTSQDVSAAYRAAFDAEVAAAEAYWDDFINDSWWEGYKRGQASESSMAPVIVQAMRRGFSFESGYEAGLVSEDIDVQGSYQDGWNSGFIAAWQEVVGDDADAPPPPIRSQSGGGNP